jgi:hypothetical protein
VREEVRHIRSGKHGARSAKQAIAIGLSKARRAGVNLPPAQSNTRAGRKSQAVASPTVQGNAKPQSRRCAQAATAALKREGHAAASTGALKRQAQSAAAKRSAGARSAAARKAARTKGPAGRRAAAGKAAWTRARSSG